MCMWADVQVKGNETLLLNSNLGNSDLSSKLWSWWVTFLKFASPSLYLPLTNITHVTNICGTFKVNLFWVS